MDDNYFMKLALEKAKLAYEAGEVPIGCVIVRKDKVIGSGYNMRMSLNSALAHGEIIAIKQACETIGDWRLEDCTLYVTVEPCPMCAGVIIIRSIS